MSFKLAEKYLRNKAIRKLALIYGVIMVNAGALLLYNKFSAPELVFDQGAQIGAACLGIGLVVLFLVNKYKGES